MPFHAGGYHVDPARNSKQTHVRARAWEQVRRDLGLPRRSVLREVYTTTLWLMLFAVIGVLVLVTVAMFVRVVGGMS